MCLESKKPNVAGAETERWEDGEIQWRQKIILKTSRP
jgi:hypothetical protein